MFFALAQTTGLDYGRSPGNTLEIQRRPAINRTNKDCCCTLFASEPHERASHMSNCPKTPVKGAIVMTKQIHEVHLSDWGQSKKTSAILVKRLELQVDALESLHNRSDPRRSRNQSKLIKIIMLYCLLVTQICTTKEPATCAARAQDSFRKYAIEKYKGQIAQ